MATLPSGVTIDLRFDSAQVADTLGVLSQAFQDCADALLMARDRLEEAWALAEREAKDEAAEPIHEIHIFPAGEIGRRMWNCKCGEGNHEPVTDDDARAAGDAHLNAMRGI